MAAHVIETEGLRKIYGNKAAVRNLSITVDQGEVFGFLGPNGAGKSTSIKMLLGLVRPSGGSARTLGHSVGDTRVRAKIGFLPEHFRFYDWLTGRELLRLHGRLYGMRQQTLEQRSTQLIELVGLSSHAEKPLRQYSKGMLQRIGLAQALLNDPDLIFLDEPTSGLDPGGRILVRDIIREQRAQGKTVFLNSHLLGEVEITCDRVAFVSNGRVLEIRNLNDERQRGARYVIRADNLTEDALDCVRPLIADVRRDAGKITFAAEEKQIPTVIRILAGKGADIYSCTREKLSLEDMFMSIIGKDGGL